MKKAKVILSTVALFAVVGGALAFKARNLGTVYINTTDAAGALHCNFKADFVPTAVAGSIIVGTTVSTTASCPATQTLRVTTTGL